MSGPWNLTEAQRRQFREAHATAQEQQRAAELRAAADEATIPKHWFSLANDLQLFPLDMCEIRCPDCDRTAYPDDLGEALDWALGHACVDGTPKAEG